jgi:hypothetical protein
MFRAVLERDNNIWTDINTTNVATSFISAKRLQNVDAEIAATYFSMSLPTVKPATKLIMTMAG